VTVPEGLAQRLKGPNVADVPVLPAVSVWVALEYHAPVPLFLLVSDQVPFAAASTVITSTSFAALHGVAWHRKTLTWPFVDVGPAVPDTVTLLVEPPLVIDAMVTVGATVSTVTVKEFEATDVLLAASLAFTFMEWLPLPSGVVAVAV
jgi:hypothetical protein